MTSWFTRILLLVLLVSVVALVFETKRMAVQVGDAERAAAVWQQRAEQAEQLQSLDPDVGKSDPDAGQPNAGQPNAGESRLEKPVVGSGSSTVGEPNAAAAAAAAAAAGTEGERSGPSAPVNLDAFTKLQVDLHTTRQQLAAVSQLLEQRNAEIEQRRAAAAAVAEASMKPMPAGVRLCLDTLHECLRSEGYTHQRFLRAGSLDDKGLHDVEMLESSRDGLAVAFLTAKLMTATFDRSAGQCELRFFEGHRAVDGERAGLPEEGFAIVFNDVDGRLFEGRLPYLVRGEGAYPAAITTTGRAATDVDAGTRRQWLSRFDKLLGQAATKESWRVTRLKGMSDGQFLTVELIGTDEKNLVKSSVHCGQMAVEIDEQAGVVSLLLRDGVLRRGTLESTITREGYRMLLPGLTPKATIDAMLGMVVKK